MERFVAFRNVYKTSVLATVHVLSYLLFEKHCKATFSRHWNKKIWLCRFFATLYLQKNPENYCSSWLACHIEFNLYYNIILSIETIERTCRPFDCSLEKVKENFLNSEKVWTLSNTFSIVTSWFQSLNAKVNAKNGTHTYTLSNNQITTQDQLIINKLYLNHKRYYNGSTVWPQK